MKEIIEKYKNEELTLYEFLKSGYTLEHDVDQYKHCGSERLITSKHFVDNMIDPGDKLRFVIKSTQLDKEIAAMEKQPEYDYVKVTESIFDLKDDFDSKGLFYYEPIALTDKWEYFLIDSMDMLLIKASLGDLYRRVEITPEQKREREVKGLARKMFASDTLENDSDNWAELTDHIQNSYLSMAEAALKWVESKK